MERMPTTNNEKAPKPEIISEKNFSEQIEVVIETVRKKGKEVMVSTDIPGGGSLIEHLKRWRIKGIDPSDEKKIFPLVIDTSLIVRDEKGSEFDLVTLLPDENVFIMHAAYNRGVIFKESISDKERIFINHTFYNEENEPSFVTVLYSKPSQPGDILCLLHELGHVYDSEEVNEKITDIMGTLGRKQRKAQRENRAIASNDEVLVMLPNERNEEVPTPLPRDLYFEYHKLNSRNERGAWAFALRQLRRIRAKGVDIEPELYNSKKIDEIVHQNSLRTYKDDLKLRTVLKKDLADSFENFYTRK